MSVSSPSFGRVEMHSTSKNDAGVMSMAQIDAVEVPAGGSTVMEPGGLHLMLFEPTGAFTNGSTVPFTLTFETAGTREVLFTVVENPSVPVAANSAATAEAKAKPEDHSGH
jgi:copper(I)-binding protein